MTCPTCNGSGGQCLNCGGSGVKTDGRAIQNAYGKGVVPSEPTRHRSDIEPAEVTEPTTPADEPEKCLACNGEGFVPRPNLYHKVRICPDCRGTRVAAPTEKPDGRCRQCGDYAENLREHYLERHADKQEFEASLAEKPEHQELREIIVHAMNRSYEPYGETATAEIIDEALATINAKFEAAMQEVESKRIVINGAQKARRVWYGDTKGGING